MTGKWIFHNPVKVSFGAGSVATSVAALPYRRMLLVTSPGMTRRGAVQGLKAACNGAIAEVYDGVVPNPEMSALDGLALRYRHSGFDAIVALGGGSALDTAKILGVLLGTPSEFTLRAHFIDKQAIPTVPAVPVIAIPTTAGTGSEVTPFATVWDARAVKKYSLANVRLFPVQALLDPELTHTLPWDITLSTGLDAFCQAMEAIWNRNANPITIGYGIRAAKLAWHVLGQGEALMTSPQARSDMMTASLLAGFAISQTRTALCHSMSYPVTAKFGLPHGLACGFTMPAVLRYNAPADDGRLADAAIQLGVGSTSELAENMAALLRRLEVPAMVRAAIGGLPILTSLTPKMITQGRADNNLRHVEADALPAILAEAWRDLHLANEGGVS